MDNGQWIIDNLKRVDDAIPRCPLSIVHSSPRFSSNQIFRAIRPFYFPRVVHNERLAVFSGGDDEHRPVF